MNITGISGKNRFTSLLRYTQTKKGSCKELNKCFSKTEQQFGAKCILSRKRRVSKFVPRLAEVGFTFSPYLGNLRVGRKKRSNFEENFSTKKNDLKFVAAGFSICSKHGI